MGPTGPAGPQGPSGDVKGVASYYSLTTQTITNVTTVPTPNPTVFSFPLTFVQRNGISLIEGNAMRVPRTGVYEAWYSIQIDRTSGGSPAYVYIWLRVNGTDVPDSNGRININSNNGDALPIVPYILELNAGDQVQFVAQATEDNIQVLYVADAGIPGPAIPSIIVGIKEVSAF